MEKLVNTCIKLIFFVFSIFQTNTFASDSFIIRIPNTNDGKEEIEVTSIIINDPKEREEAIKLVSNQIRNFETAIIAVDTGSSSDANSPKNLALEIAQTSDNEIVVLEPTEELNNRVSQINEFYFTKMAEKNLGSIRTVLAVIRAIVAGSVTSVALVCMQLPIPAIIAGAVTAAYISGKMQLLNDYYKEWFTRRAFFDPKDHTNDHRIGWRVLYGTWKLIKESFLVLGYLTGMHWILASFGGPHDFFENSIAWLGTAGRTAILASLSEGIWSIFDADLRKELLIKNFKVNQFNPEQGISGAKKILLRSQFIAIAISAVSTIAEVFSAGCSMESNPIIWRLTGQDISHHLLIGVGISGFSVYLFRCTDLPVIMKKFLSITKNCLYSFIKLK